MNDLEQKLISEAVKALETAFCPYSKFSVGAALLLTNGEIIHGCNVENISFGLTMCAERVAVGTAIAMGQRSFETLAIAADSGEPIVPCGACRQVLAEFCPTLRIFSTTLDGKVAEFSLDILFPRPRQGILS